MRIGSHSRVVRFENQRELVPTIRSKPLSRNGFVETVDIYTRTRLKNPKFG